jgi:hypothetical protein
VTFRLHSKFIALFMSFVISCSSVSRAHFETAIIFIAVEGKKQKQHNKKYSRRIFIFIVSRTEQLCVLRCRETDLLTRLVSLFFETATKTVQTTRMMSLGKSLAATQQKPGIGSLRLFLCAWLVLVSRTSKLTSLPYQLSIK